MQSSIEEKDLSSGRKGTAIGIVITLGLFGLFLAGFLQYAISLLEFLGFYALMIVIVNLSYELSEGRYNAAARGFTKGSVGVFLTTVLLGGGLYAALAFVAGTGGQ